jgi:hypothetical protein
MKITKTYNIEVPVVDAFATVGTGIAVVQAYTCQVTPSGCLIFINTNDRVIFGFRDGEWTRFWMIPEE